MAIVTVTATTIPRLAQAILLHLNQWEKAVIQFLCEFLFLLNKASNNFPANSQGKFVIVVQLPVRATCAPLLVEASKRAASSYLHLAPYD
jgi:hypothetical protein